MNYRGYVFALVAAVVTGALAVPDLTEVPDGASIKLFPNYEFQLTGVASGTYDFDDPDDVLDAQKEGTLRAKAVLAKFMKEDLSTEEGMVEASKKVKSVESDGETTTTNVSKESVKASMTAIHNQANALLKGVIVLRTQKVPASGTKGTVRVMVGVSSKTLKAVEAVTGAMQDSASPAQATTAAAAGDAAEGDDASAPADAVCPEGWITCVGSGTTRYAAVQAALTEGISQVYGEKLLTDTRMQERSTKLKANLSIMGSNKEMAARMSSKEVQTDTMTSTAGFVKAYRVVKFVSNNGALEATVYAYIVNPRDGGAVALLVKKPTMDVGLRSTVFKLNKWAKSGGEIAEAIQFSLPSGLENAGKFIILTENSLRSGVQNAALTKALVKTGVSNASELNQVGQMLSPDYSLTTELTDIKCQKKMGRNPATKKIGSLYSLSLTLRVSLFDERQGKLAKSDAVKLSLDNDELTDLFLTDDDPDPLAAVVRKLAKPLEAMIKGGK